MISILAISDVHLGCPRLDARNLHNRFRKYLYPLITEDIDILFICGDFFDGSLTMSALSSLESLEIIAELKMLCRQAHCDLRVLRGTFSHDQTQPKHFVYSEDPNGTEVRLYDSMAIEFNKKTGLNILYIPDNIASQDIYADINELLSKHGLESVDIMVHHGYFNHLLGPNAPVPHGSLDAERVGKFVTGCVLNGHVHHPGVYRNVISVGSFDRLTHGEETPKGFYRVDIGDDRVYKFTFIENKDANKFLTFDLRSYGTLTTQVVDIFTKKWSEILPTFHDNEIVRVRFLSDDASAVEACTHVAKSSYERVLFDKATVAKREKIIENVHTSLDELPVITPDNLQELLMPIISKSNPNITPLEVHNILKACS